MGKTHGSRQVDLCNDGPVTVELSGLGHKAKAVAGATRPRVARRLGCSLAGGAHWVSQGSSEKYGKDEESEVGHLDLR